MSRATASIAIIYLLATGFAGAAEKIDINTAPLGDLLKIVHIGEVRAQELISLRPFSSIDDLDRIKGIGTKRIEDIKKQGLAWVGSSTELLQPNSQASPEEVKTSSPPAEESPTEPSPIKEGGPKDVVAVGEQITNPLPFLVFLIASTLAIFSGTMVLLLKKRLK
mgnify:FL=1